MAKKTIVRRYTEDQMVTLLENIVKRVKEEKKLEESRKTRKNSLTEDFKSNGTRRPSTRKNTPNRRRRA